jgi:group I intron endonuclease
MTTTFYGVVYIATNITNEKKYVGQTTSKNPMKYCMGHFIAARKDSQKAFHIAIRKYGSASFTFEIVLRAADKVSLDTTEDSFIEFFDTLSPNGYNLRGGGNFGKHTDELKAQISASVKRTWDDPEIKEKRLVGLRLASTEEVVLQRATSLRVTLAKPEIRKKYSLASKNRCGNKEQLRLAGIKVIETPHILDKRNTSIKDAWSSLELRERQSRIVREIWARRKETRS